MSLRKIENIKIGEFPAGTAFGAFVYNVNINVGVNGDSTSVTVDLINEDGNYNINTSALNAVAPRSIKFGNLSSSNPKDFIFLKSMFLVDFSYNQGVGARTLSLKFVDGATVLDKIQVLILNKQATPLNINGNRRGLWDIGLRSYDLPVSCNNRCPQTDAPPWGPNSVNPWPTGHLKSFGYLHGQGRSGRSVTITRPSVFSLATNVDPTNLAMGGVIIIGEEEFVSSECQIPNVSYTFGDLINVIVNFLGIPVINLSERNTPVRESFEGSLREVLNSWCGLYGYSFAWDFATNSILGKDLINPSLPTLEPIFQLVNATKEGSTETPVAISDIQRNFSIEGTYHQDHISNYVKPARTATHKDKITKRIFFKPFNLYSIIPESGFENYTGGRTPQEFLISCILSRFNVNARTLYNYYLIANKTNHFTQNVLKYGAPIGVNVRHMLSESDKLKILTYTMSLKESEKHNKKYGIGAGVGIGTYNKELEDSWVQWERGIADFIGKYYYYPQTIKDSFFCNASQQIKFIREVSTKPNAEAFAKGSDQTEEFPFNKLLRHPNGVTNMNLLDDNGNLMNSFYLYGRNPSYGTKEQEFKDMFYHQGEDVLKDYLPSFADLDGNQKLFLDQPIKRCFPSAWTNLESITDENKKAKLLFFPTIANITSVMNIGNLNGNAGWHWVYNLNNSPFVAASGNVINKKEFKPEEPKEEKTCEAMVCNKDLISWLCECPEGDQYDPNNVGLTNQSAQWFRVAVNKSSVGGGSSSMNVILPSEYPYSGYIEITQEISRTVMGIMQHFGLLNNAQGTMAYRVSSKNITSDIDALDDAGKSGVPVPNGQESGQIVSHVMVPGKGRIAAQVYHNQTNTAHTNAVPSEKLSFTMIGLDFGAFWPYINIQNGLDSMSISLAEDGTKISVSLATKPKTLPNLDRLLPKIETRLNSNMYHRLY